MHVKFAQINTRLIRMYIRVPVPRRYDKIQYQGNRRRRGINKRFSLARMFLKKFLKLQLK